MSSPERGEGVTGYVCAADLRIGGADVRQDETIPEPTVMRRAESVNWPSAGGSNPETQASGGMEHKHLQNVGDIPERTTATEFGGRVAVDGARAASSVDAMRPADPYGDAQPSPDEIPGQLALPFDAVPLEPGMFVQGKFEFDGLTEPSQDQTHAARSETSISLAESPELMTLEEVPQTPEEIIAGYRERTVEALKATAEKHARLTQEHADEWQKFLERLAADSAVCEVDPTSLSISLRFDVNESDPLKEIDSVSSVPPSDGMGPFEEYVEPPEHKFRYIDITMDPSNFSRALPLDMRQAAGWLAGTYHPESKQLKGTKLLEVPATKGADGKYGYDEQSLSVRLAEELVKHTTGATITYYKQAKSKEGPYGWEECLTVEAPNEYNTKMSDNLKKVVDGTPHGERVIQRNMEELRDWAQLHHGDLRDFGRLRDPLAFPTDAEIEEVLAERYLLVQSQHVDDLKTINGDLSQMGVVSRLFPKSKDVRKR